MRAWIPANSGQRGLFGNSGSSGLRIRFPTTGGGTAFGMPVFLECSVEIVVSKSKRRIRTVANLRTPDNRIARIQANACCRSLSDALESPGECQRSSLRKPTLMSDTQPAVVNYAPNAGCVEIREIPIPYIGPEDVLMKVAAVGVCGSDLHQWTAEHSWPVNYPVTLGHEFAGTIEKAGASVTGFSVGDRVCSETAAVIDAHSPLSRVGRYNLDPARKGFGYGVDGAMTTQVRVPARCLHHVPDGLSLKLAALTEPCCVAFSAVAANADILPGDRILVLGPGPIGLLCAAIARMRGAEVALVGLARDENRLALANALGCEALTVDLAQDWARQRDGLGCDGVVDAAGVSATLQTAMELVRPAGWISKVGWGRQPLDFSLDPLVQKNVRLQGSFSHTWATWERVLVLLASRALPVETIVGGHWSLDQWESAFETMHSGAIAKSLLVVSSDCDVDSQIYTDSPLWTEFSQSERDR